LLNGHGRGWTGGGGRSSAGSSRRGAARCGWKDGVSVRCGRLQTCELRRWRPPCTAPMVSNPRSEACPPSETEWSASTRTSIPRCPGAPGGDATVAATGARAAVKTATNTRDTAARRHAAAPGGGLHEVIVVDSKLEFVDSALARRGGWVGWLRRAKKTVPVARLARSRP